VIRAEAASALARYLDDRRARVEAALARCLEETLVGAPPDVAEVVRYACAGPAKRLRPILTCAVAEALGAELAAEGLGCAVEVLHGYSLVHDDLPSMDDDDVRRGRPTAHRRFGAARAARAAAAMIPLAFEILAREATRLGLPANTLREMALDLAQGAGAGGMVGGQWLDLVHGPAPADRDLARAIDERKTAALFVAAARIGARAAGAPEPARDAVTAYARHVGLAFQRRDDTLDATREPAGPTPTGGAEAESRKAVRALRTAGLADPVLEAIAAYAAKRDR
jgi:geranylgeranyl pyrophosphate synthase